MAFRNAIELLQNVSRHLLEFAYSSRLGGVSMTEQELLVHVPRLLFLGTAWVQNRLL